MKVTVDASVWLSAQSPGERDHADAMSLIAALVSRGAQLHQPGLFIVEVCATIARRTGNRERALASARHALATPGLVLHELKHRLAADATDIAAACALRGADAVYVATSRMAGATLVTLDRELHERARSIVAVRTPAEWLVEVA